MKKKTICFSDKNSKSEKIGSKSQQELGKILNLFGESNGDHNSEEELTNANSQEYLSSYKEGDDWNSFIEKICLDDKVITQLCDRNISTFLEPAAEEDTIILSRQENENRVHSPEKRFEKIKNVWIFCFFIN